MDAPNFYLRVGFNSTLIFLKTACYRVKIKLFDGVLTNKLFCYRSLYEIMHFCPYFTILHSVENCQRKKLLAENFVHQQKLLLVDFTLTPEGGPLDTIYFGKNPRTLT